MVLSYRQFCQIGREQWLIQPNFPRQVFVRLFGPLGVHARIRNARMINAINRLELPAQAQILDAGCGHAYTTFFLAKNYPGYHFTALEVDETLVNEGRRITAILGLNNVTFLHNSVLDIDTLSNFDLVFSIDMLEHIIDDVGTLRIFHRILKPTGSLLLHLPRRHQEHRRFLPVFKNHTTPDHVRDEYTSLEISSKLTQTNYHIEYIKYGFSMWGELAFETNYLFWKWNSMRVLFAILFHPVSVRLAYQDTRRDYEDGNSLLVLAHPVSSK